MKCGLLAARSIDVVAAGTAVRLTPINITSRFISISNEVVGNRQQVESGSLILIRSMIFSKFNLSNS